MDGGIYTVAVSCTMRFRIIFQRGREDRCIRFNMSTPSSPKMRYDKEMKMANITAVAAVQLRLSMRRTAKKKGSGEMEIDDKH